MNDASFLCRLDILLPSLSNDLGGRLMCPRHSAVTKQYHLLYSGRCCELCRLARMSIRAQV